MGLIAERYEGDEKHRSKIMGIIMGAIALGVLIGYPMGSILSTLFGQAVPFFLLSGFIFVNTGTVLVISSL
jgi:DHA1 family solute carrier family 18 vesicular amine transporter 1/2